jgi:hypothetical protein
MAMTKAPAKTGGNGAAGQAPPQAPYPFPVGVYESTIQDYDNTVVLGATTAAWISPVQAPLWNVSPTGWIRRAWLDFTFFFASGNAAGAFAGDGPWSGIQKITLYDLGGEVVIQLTGYEWMVMNKFGGYFEIGDPRADLAFVTNPAAGNSQASPVAHFLLAVPFEAVSRDALGTAQNESKPGWKIEVWIDSAANMVGTGGTAFTAAAVSPQVRIRGYVDSYTEPASAAPNGRPFAQTPPLPGSLQYWKSENQALPAGTAKYDLTNGIGFPLRNVFYYGRDTGNGTRATADTNWWDPATLLIGNVNYFTRGKNLWISLIGRTYGFGAIGGAAVPQPDQPQGRENGVYPVWFTQDFGLNPGNELRFKYLDTQINSLVRITGSLGAAMTLFAMTNWLATPSQNRYSLIAGR